jgi:hypothetical protein
MKQALLTLLFVLLPVFIAEYAAPFDDQPGG